MGAFVEIAPGREGLCHTSLLASPPPRRPDDVVKVGDEIQARVVEVDQQGRINLSAIDLDKAFDPAMAKRADDRGPRDRDRGGDRGGRPGGDRGGRPGGFGGDRDRGPRPEATAAAPAPAEEDDDETPKVRFRPRR